MKRTETLHLRGLDITLFGEYDSAVFEICKNE